MKHLFPIQESGSTFTREVLAGITTFVTMSYILVVQPAVLSVDFAGSPTGLDAGAVLLATCVASALATALMGVYGRLPIALAPGMGQNYFFVSVIMALSAQSGSSPPWQTALAIVFIAGVLFLLLTLVGLRDLVLDVMSPSMRSAMAVGIGLFIAFIGLTNAGVVADAPSLVSLNAATLTSPDAIVFWAGLLATMILMCLRVQGGILLGIFVSSALAWQFGKVSFNQVVGWPEFQSSPVFQFDFGGALTAMGLTYIAIFLFMDVFDTTGTLVAVSEQAGLVQNGKLPRLRQAMVADAAGTIVGACMGTSTVTSYIESATGVQQGGRTGLTAIVVAILFLLAIPFSRRHPFPTALAD